MCPQPEQSPQTIETTNSDSQPGCHGGHRWEQPGVRHRGLDERHSALAVEGNEVLTLATRRVTSRGHPRARREDGLSQGPACGHVQGRQTHETERDCWGRGLGRECLQDTGSPSGVTKTFRN